LLRFWGVLGLGLAMMGAVSAQEPLPCPVRPQMLLYLQRQRGVCAELILTQPYIPGRVFTSIAADADGVLYIAEPSAGVVWTATDTDSDAVPDALRPLLTGLEAPASLLLHAGTLYITGGRRLYAYDGQALLTLRDDLPVEAGRAARLLTVHEGRLLLSVGGCRGCAEAGRVISLALNGSDEMTLLTSVDVLAALSADALYLTTGAGEDALWVWEPGQAPRLVMRFGFGAEPTALLRYDGAAFPQFQNHVLVMLAGTELTEYPHGFSLMAVEDLGEAVMRASSIVPSAHDTPAVSVPLGQVYANPPAEKFNHISGGLAPQRLGGLAVDARGWIYLLLARGSVILLRP
jgi:hypothetical protein